MQSPLLFQSLWNILSFCTSWGFSISTTHLQLAAAIPGHDLARLDCAVYALRANLINITGFPLGAVSNQRLESIVVIHTVNLPVFLLLLCSLPLECVSPPLLSTIESP